MKTLVLSFILLIELIFQGTVFQYFNLNNYYPDLVLITLVSFSIIFEKEYAYKLGLIIGILADIIYGNVFGLHTLVYLVTTYVISLMSSNIFKENLLIPVIMFPLGALLNGSMNYLLHYLLRIDIDFWDYISKYRHEYWIVNILGVIIIYMLTLKFIKAKLFKL
ncbi:MAG: rod shape-determining protein MreD [Eubacteriaceae bacterium]